MKWADIDSDDSDDEVMNIPVQPAGLNDGTVQASIDVNQLSGSTRWADTGSGDEVDAEEQNDEIHESDAEEEEEEQETEEERIAREEALRKAKEEKKLKEEKLKADEEAKKKPLTKKEKQALKAKEMNEMDDLFNEFGVAPTASNEEETEQAEDDNNNQEEGEQATQKSKKKRKKKKKNGSTTKDAEPESNFSFSNGSEVEEDWKKVNGEVHYRLRAASRGPRA